MWRYWKILKALVPRIRNKGPSLVEPLSTAIPSPDGASTAALTYAGEIPFGPRYFHLEINDHSLGDRIFGQSLLWSDDSKLLAAEEWLSTKESNGPRTRLVVFDVVSGREWASGVAEGGFITPLTFSRRHLTFNESYFGRGTVIEHDCELLPPSQWPLGGTP